MTVTRLSFSDRSVATLPFTKKGQVIVRDSDLPGFFIRIGTKTKAYMVQGDLWIGDKRQSILIKVGEVGKLAAREARAKAKVLLGSIADGVDPRLKPEPAPDLKPKPATGDPTLREAWDSYCESHMRRKNRSEGTISNYRDHVERLLTDWLDQPLSVLGDDPGLVKARHDKLTADNGPYIANGCMRSLRAIYNHARKTARSLPPENPVLAVDWNLERRRDTAMGVADISGWLAELAELDNPMRREFHLFLLLTGSRPDPIKRARLEHLDLRQRVLHIPKPKGGVDRAFDIPLSREMIRTIVRAMRLGRKIYPAQAQTWLFPADSATGHLVEHKEDREDLSKWGNDLRQTYRTVGQAAGVNEVDMHLLMNHSLPGVNAGYITRNKLLGDHLRKQQQAISAKIFGTIAKALEEPGALADWLSPRASRRCTGVEAPTSRAMAA
jgi:site-specific recombinase XerD